MATNNLGAYNPVFYATQALIHLRKNLGMAATVYGQAIEEEHDIGEVITIRKPAKFTAQAAPGSDQDLPTENVSLTVDQWYETRFTVTDKEFAFTGDRIVREHIDPMAYALADQIDQSLIALYDDIPWRYDLTAAGTTVADLVGTRRVLRENAVPLSDRSNMWMMIDPYVEEDLLALEAFSQQQGAGQTGVRTQVTGMLGEKYGFGIIPNQNVDRVAHTSGTVISAGTDAVGAVNGAHAKGATSLAINGLSLTETILVGDSFSIAGHTQRYVATADLTLSAGAGTLSIAPGLESALSGSEVVTFDADSASVHAGSYYPNLAYHRNAFGIVFVQLPTALQRLGAKVYTAIDPVTGLSVRARIFANNSSSSATVVLDALWGVVTLDRNMACLMRRDA